MSKPLVWKILRCIDPSLPNIHINKRGYKHCYTFRVRTGDGFFREITHEKNINHTHAHTWTSIKTDKGISEINQPWGAILVQSSQTLHYIFFYHHHVSMSLSPYHLCHDALTLTSWSKNLPGQTISGQFVEPD